MDTKNLFPNDMIKDPIRKIVDWLRDWRSDDKKDNTDLLLEIGEDPPDDDYRACRCFTVRKVVFILRQNERPIRIQGIFRVKVDFNPEGD
jgi:hypothetical protein